MESPSGGVLQKESNSVNFRRGTQKNSRRSKQAIMAEGGPGEARGQLTWGVMGEASLPTGFPGHRAVLALALMGVRCQELC